MAQVEILEDESVGGAGAVWASNGKRTIIVLHPDLSAVEKLELVRELTEE